MLRNMLAAKNHRSCLYFNINKLIIVCTAVTAAAMSFWHDSKLDLNVRTACGTRYWQFLFVSAELRRHVLALLPWSCVLIIQ